jgi:hypothetical protein
MPGSGYLSVMNPNKLPFFRFKLFRIGLGLFVLLYAFLMVRSLIPATIHDQELQLPRADIPAGANAFDVLQTANSHRWWPDTRSQQLDDLTRDTNWDDALASTVLASNRETLAGWDTAAKLPDFQVPEISNFDYSFLYLPNWRELAQVAEVRVNYLSHHGQDKEAFDEMMTIVKLGRRMQNAHGPLIDYLVGLAVNSMGLNQMRYWAGKAQLTADQLKDYIRQLQLNPDEEGDAFANTIKGEYQFQVQMLDAVRQRKITNSDPDEFYFRPMRFLPVFNFSQTKALFAGEDLKLVKAAPHHFSETKLFDLELHQPGVVSLFLSGNAAGQILYYMAMPAVIPSLATKSMSDTQLQATRTIIALRAYQLTHGHLPTDLSALVPEFLDEVPVDDFDGQPLRYSAERKIVYSVGKNLKDDGGDDTRSGPNDSHLDLVYKFDF